MSYDNPAITMNGDIVKAMNGTVASSDHSNNNGSAVVDPASGEAPTPPKCDRFRISKLPTGEELQTINAVIDGIDGVDVVPPVGDDVLADGENNADGAKHVQLNLPADYNEATHNRTNTHTYTSGYMSHDAVPLSVFYRNQASIENATGTDTRPTLDQLHKGKDLENAKMRHWDASKDPIEEHGDTLERSHSNNNLKSIKLGWIKGVLVPTLLNIWGVILFLRMPWIVGQSGIGMSTVIVLLATFVTVVTALSMSAVCTNGEIKGGGAYYLISRSLGPEFGGSIGVIFSVANAVAVSLYLVGFAETVQALMEEHGAIMVDRMNDIRIIGILALVLIFLITMVGLEWVIHTQSFLLLLLIASILATVAGTIYPSPTESRAKMKSEGLAGYSWGNFKTNFYPYEEGVRFFDVFSIFFPAATGIMAGSNLSGDLKDPSEAVPLGTLLAIAVSSVGYIILAWLLGASVMRGASGVIPTMVAYNATVGFNQTIPAAHMTNATCIISQCKYGSIQDLQVNPVCSVNVLTEGDVHEGDYVEDLGMGATGHCRYFCCDLVISTRITGERTQDLSSSVQRQDFSPH